LENVEEFLNWGPLDHKGRVIKSQQGATFKAFVRRLRRQGYSVQYGELRACDYGAPTSRKRLFLIARRDRHPIRWPRPTHGPGTDTPYRTAAECIDWSLPCPSIFLSKEEGKRYGVKRPLAEKTLQRIAKGVDKFVLQDPEPYVVNSSPPAPASRNRYGEVQELLRDVGAVPFVSKMRGGATGFPCTAPMHTITSGGDPARPSTGNPLALAVPFLAPRYGERPGQEPRTQPANQPLATITGTNNGGRIAVAHLAKHYSGVTGQEMTAPIGSITSRDHHSLVVSHLLHMRNNCDSKDIHSPVPTLTAGGGHIGEVRAFLLKYCHLPLPKGRGLPEGRPRR
jgi:DNA (cytosine-5)-methyltransferase 1